MHPGDPGAGCGAEPPPGQRSNGGAQGGDMPWVVAVTLRDAALRYAAAGLPVLPLVPRGKKPLLSGGFQNASTDAVILRSWWRATPDANIGLVTGRRSGLFALDIDGRAGETSLVGLERAFGPLPETLTNLTGHGRQLLFAMPGRDLRCRVGVRPGLDVRAEGGYVTVPPSIHPLTGRAYQWAGADPTIARAATAPEWLIELIAHRNITSSPAAPMPTDGKRIIRYIQSALDAEAKRVAAALPGSQEWTLNAAAFSIGGLVAEGHLSLDEAIGALVQAGLRMVNDPRRRPWTSGEIEAKVRRGLADGAARAPRRFPVPEPASAKREAVQPGRAVTAGDWYALCQTGAKGRPLSNHANTMLALRGDTAWDGVLAFDEMQGAVVIHKPIPVHGRPSLQNGFAARPLTEDDISTAQEWLQIAGLRSSGRDTVHHALVARARERAFHPVRDWLGGLRWDGTERLETWLSDCLGAESGDYARAVGRMFLVAMVARVCRPGCKVDHMPVFEGEQGARKSSACAVLGGPWFSDAMPGDVTAKDASQHLRGKWLIEFGEMHALTRSETTALKAFVTRRTEIYRPPYGRAEVAEPRQCVFVGTTNRSVYLRDDTGGRRFWPVRVGDIRLDRLADIRDQLFAEALVRFRDGEPWGPDVAFEHRWIRPEQDARLEPEAWDELVENYLHDRQRVTALEVARNALGIETPRVGRSEINRITAILERTGWWRGQRDGGSRWWVLGGQCERLTP